MGFNSGFKGLTFSYPHYGRKEARIGSLARHLADANSFYCQYNASLHGTCGA